MKITSKLNLRDRQNLIGEICREYYTSFGEPLDLIDLRTIVEEEADRRWVKFFSDKLKELNWDDLMAILHEIDRICDQAKGKITKTDENSIKLIKKEKKPRKKDIH